MLSVAAAMSAMPMIARADVIFEGEQGSQHRVGAYTTTGATVNASLITGLGTPQGGGPEGIAVSGSNLFVAYGGGFISGGSDKVGEYTTSGAPVNASLITGLSLGNNQSIALSGSNLFTASTISSSIGEYTTSGATVNASLITGLFNLEGVAVSGSDLFVLTGNQIGEYTTSGATVNASLITGLSQPLGLAVSGSNLFVTNNTGGTVGEYTTSGATVNASLITGLSGPIGIAVSGSNLFVTNSNIGTIAEYTTSGATVNASLITGLDNVKPIAVAPVPEPSTAMLLTGGLAVLSVARRRRAD